MTKREKMYREALEDIKMAAQDIDESSTTKLELILEIVEGALMEQDVPWPDALQGYEYEGNKRYQKFVEDVQRAILDEEFVDGEEPEFQHYRGRFYYEGPAVVCSGDQLQKVMGCTDVPLTKDNMGFDWVVYPK